jgi:hypothetical protein
VRTAVVVVVVVMLFSIVKCAAPLSGRAV